MAIKPVRGIDRDEAVAGFRQFMLAMGYDLDGDPNMNAAASGRDTAERAVDAYIEFLTYQQDQFDVTTFETESAGIVSATNLEFASLCCHHMLPYSGFAHIGYLPCGKVAGLSKLVRILDHYSHRLSIQEHITDRVATFIMEQIGARGCGVIIEAEHFCMSMRGVRRPGHVTVTSDFRGVFQEDAVKMEFLALVERGRKV